MDSFNLNSDSYNEVEIEELFNLKPVYTIKDIATAKTVLINQLSNNSNLGAEKQREIMFFIDTIANRVINKVANRTNAGNNAYNGNNAYTAPHENIITTQGTNFLIEKPDRLAGRTADFTMGRITVDSTPAPPGYINPINVRTITQAISFDTRFRPNYYASKSTNFDIILPAIQKNVLSMRVATIELPLTYYAVSLSQGNATALIINLATTTPQQCWVLTLPDGNYEQSWSDHSKAAFIEPAMNTAIQTAVPATIDENGMVTVGAPGSPAPLLANALVYSLDRISGRSIFSAPTNSVLANSGFTIRFNVDNQGSLNMDTSIQLRLGWQLGFRAAEYVCRPYTDPTTQLITNNATCVSEGICLISGPRYGFLAIDDYQKNTGPAYMVAFGNSILQNNIITRINLAALQAEVGIYQSSSDAGLTTEINRTREYFGPVDIQRLHVTLYDEYGRVIDLNNMDWSFSLAFQILYN
jgi:hypothetical protein